MVSRLASALLLIAVAGCDVQAPGQQQGANVSLEVGHAVGYRLYTHCGILSVQLNGKTFFATPPLSDGSANPPGGWGNPYDDGQITLMSSTQAVFTDTAGNTARFSSNPPAPPPSIGVCF